MVTNPRPVTVKALQALLTRIGSASSGTKDVLRARFERDVKRARLFSLRPEWAARQKKDWGRKLRIISIDMGIKNLAYCDIEVDYPYQDAMKPTIDIIRWEKLNLADATRDLRRPLLNPRLTKEETPDTDEDADPYSLYVLSQMAYQFIRRPVLEVKPDIILIERQRWRSASSAAIQQWTVRVNTLEAMLWTILETLRAERFTLIPKLKDAELQRRNYEVYGVDPKRVGQYWLGQLAKAIEEKQSEPLPGIEIDELQADEAGKASEKKKVPRSKAEKKAKIALLQSWLSTEPASTASTTPTSAPKISFTIGLGASKAREALCIPTPTHLRRKKSKVTKDGDTATNSDEAAKAKNMKKLDDITDCCLQVAAWVAWESNRLQLWDVWNAKRGDDGVLPDLSEELLKEMIHVAGE